MTSVCIKNNNALFYQPFQFPVGRFFPLLKLIIKQKKRSAEIMEKKRVNNDTNGGNFLGDVRNKKKKKKKRISNFPIGFTRRKTNLRVLLARLDLSRC